MYVKWYEVNRLGGGSMLVANPDFVKTETSFLISNYSVSQSEFHRVLAEWEADQHATEPEPVEPQWKPKVGDWVRVKNSGRTELIGSVGRVQSLQGLTGVRLNIATDFNFTVPWLEPATPQLIDKLGWWLIDGECDCFIIRDGRCIESENDCVDTYDNASRYGIFLAEITDEELVAYHRNRIVPKCPVEVQS